MNPVSVIRDTGRIFMQGGIRTWTCTHRTRQFIAPRWSGQIDSWIWIILKGQHCIFLKGGQVIGDSVNIRVWEGRAGLPCNREAGINSHIKQFCGFRGRHAIEVSTAILSASYLKKKKSQIQTYDTQHMPPWHIICTCCEHSHLYQQPTS